MNVIQVQQCLGLQYTLNLGPLLPLLFMEQVKAMAFSCPYIVNAYDWVLENEY